MTSEAPQIPSRATRPSPLAAVLHAIINPASGGGSARRCWGRIARRIRALGLKLEEHHTTRPGEATLITRQLLADGGTEILAAGGDGTANEVVNGLFPADRESESSNLRFQISDFTSKISIPTLSVIPCGTGGDFGRNLGIGSADQAIRRILSGSVRNIDLGLLHYRDGEQESRRFFLNSADVGYGAETAAWVNRAPKGVVGGRFSYLVGGVRTIVKVPPRVATVIVDGRVVHDGPLGMAVIANGRYHAGGMMFAPEASLDDGVLDILLLRDWPRMKLLWLLPRVYWGGHIGHPAIRAVRGREIEIRAPQPIPFEVDGEQPGCTDIRAVVLPGALRVRI